jgi:MiaB/RimO family radical SAM methylthiotransferase
MDNIRDGLRNGRREILLTSQDTAVYGRDMKKGMDLGGLLRRIADKVRGQYRMRVGMMNPRGAAEILDSIKKGFDDQRVFKFFHIPVQSGSDRILQAMNRPYTLGEFLDLVGSLRSRYPDMTLSTDIIVGYPGENEEDFEESLSLIRQTDPDILNITRFSSWPGTRAHRSHEKIPGWAIKERSRKLTKVHEKLLERILERREGYHERCLVTEVGKPGTMMARDSNYTPIVIKGNKNLLGKFLDIRTVKKGPTYLISDNNWGVSDRY